mgnify:CR=1 FL=1
MEQTERLLLRSSSSEDTTPEMGILLGHALALDHKTVVVGMDLMKSSPMMKNALISGLISSGADIIDIGIVSGPVAAASAKMGDCCVYVTEFRQMDLISGYFLINKDGCPFGMEQIRRLDRIFSVDQKLPDYKSLGTVREFYNATSTYNRELQERLRYNIGGTVIINCNCGTSTDSAPQILNLLGADVISINAQKDRNFISNSLSTKEADIRHMKTLVGADIGSIGISINRIGTLMRVFNESGEPLTDEQVFVILMLFMKPARVVIPMDMTGFISDLFYGKVELDVSSPYPDPEPGNMELIMAHPDVGSIHEAIVEHDADLAYYKGGFVFKGISLSPDAIFAASAISQFSGENNMQELVESFPEYYSEEKSYKISCSHDDFIRMMNSCLPEINPMKITEDKSWRVDMDGGNFYIEFDPDSEDAVNVRAESNDLDIHRLAVRIIGLPTRTVIRLARDEVDPSHVTEEVLVGIGRLVRISGM